MTYADTSHVAGFVDNMEFYGGIILKGKWVYRFGNVVEHGACALKAETVLACVARRRCGRGAVY